MRLFFLSLPPIWLVEKENMRIGLIINPVAGLGGRVGLKGSDGLEIQNKARALGAVPQAHIRTAQALIVLLSHKNNLEMFTPPAEMGEDVAREVGFSPRVLGSMLPAQTSAEDTICAAREMLAVGVDLILFAGGDGTARDILVVVGRQIPVLGIPAGVKIHSAVFATHPRVAGEVVVDYLFGGQVHLRDAEVVDLDENSYREGKFTTRLYGYMRVPYRSHSLQNRKSPTPASEKVRAQAIAEEVFSVIQAGCLIVLGPGTTTRAVAERLGFEKTLVGVDVYTLDGVVALDVDENRLLHLVESAPARLVITPIGGQGFILGRGNQQISPRVIERIGCEHIIVVCLPEKLNDLKGEPLLVDTGDAWLDQKLCGYLPVITGYREKVFYRVSA